MPKTAEDLRDMSEELAELQHEIAERVLRAKELLRSAPSEINQRARYWLSQLEVALSDEHEWVGSSACTMADTVDELDEAADEREDEELALHDDAETEDPTDA